MITLAVMFVETVFAAPDMEYKAGPMHTMQEVDTALKTLNIGLDTADSRPINTEDELRLFLQSVGVDTSTPMYLLLSAEGSGWRITNTPPAGKTKTAEETRRRPGFSGIELKNSHRHRVPVSEIADTSAEATLKKIITTERATNSLLTVEMSGDYGIANISYLTASGEDLQKLIVLLKQQIQENGELREDCEKLLGLIEGHLKGDLAEFKSIEERKGKIEGILQDNPQNTDLLVLVKGLEQILEKSPFQRVGDGATIAADVSQDGEGNLQAVGNGHTQTQFNQNQRVEKGDVFGGDYSLTINNLTLDGESGGKTLTIKKTVKRARSLNMPRRAAPVAVYHLSPGFDGRSVAEWVENERRRRR